MNEDTLEIIYKSIMTVWYYLPLFMVYHFFVVKKDGKAKFESQYADKCIKLTQDYCYSQYRELEKKVLIRIEYLNTNPTPIKKQAKTFEIKDFKKKESSAA